MIKPKRQAAALRKPEAKRRKRNTRWRGREAVMEYLWEKFIIEEVNLEIEEMDDNNQALGRFSI